MKLASLFLLFAAFGLSMSLLSSAASAEGSDPQSAPYGLYLYCNGIFSTTDSKDRIEPLRGVNQNNWIGYEVPVSDAVRTGFNGGAVSVLDDTSPIVWVVDVKGVVAVHRTSDSPLEKVALFAETPTPRRFLPSRRRPGEPVFMDLAVNGEGRAQLTANSNDLEEGQTRTEFHTGDLNKKPKILLASQIGRYIKTISDSITKPGNFLKVHRDGLQALMDTIERCKPLIKDLKDSANNETADPALKGKLESEAKNLSKTMIESLQKLRTERAIYPGGKTDPVKSDPKQAGDSMLAQ